MKIQKATYDDDSVKVPGVLVERFLRKPIFYAVDNQCGWNLQIIEKTDWHKVEIVPFLPTVVGGEGSGRVRLHIKSVEDNKSE